MSHLVYLIMKYLT